MNLKSPESEHIMMLRRFVSTINISQMHDSQNFKNVVDNSISQESLNKSYERNNQNIEEENLNLFNFTEIGAIDEKK
uniref:Uncharacterized protein n=1 Tax=Strongyloides venezuelensis TaxID=75913 RepID=A0A0K0G5Y9_STRVS